MQFLETFCLFYVAALFIFLIVFADEWLDEVMYGVTSKSCSLEDDNRKFDVFFSLSILVLPLEVF